MYERVAVLGAGSWGAAIARLLDAKGVEVRLWEYLAKDSETLARDRSLPHKLPGLKLAERILVTNDLDRAVRGAELLVLAIPAQFLRSVLRQLDANALSGVGILNLAKGIEINTLKRMSEVVLEELRGAADCVATLSGPSHAEEVVKDMPTAVVAAGVSVEFTQRVQETFSNDSFRVYQSTDLVGVELGGSLKNIIAIAAGIAGGLGLGDNTMGALITRGLAEISRLGGAMGADPLTFAGLSGVGDLVTTCASRHSRNRYVGEHIGQGEKLEDILAGMSMVAEGVATTKAGKALAERHSVEMPITMEVYRVLFDGKPAAEAVGDLMGRTLKAEIWQ